MDALIDDENRARRIERARRVVGAFRSGHAHTSVGHDAALEEAFGS